MYGKPRKYTNGEITVYWRPTECIHATYCYSELIEVFNPRKRPWINMQGASTEEIIKIVNKCPTNALTYKWNKDIEKEDGMAKASSEYEQKTEIKIMEDGPLIIKGNFKIIGTDGKEMKQMKVASICRCGQSGNKPFCDGTHKKTGVKN
jgi:uncharacterized Fe-S cluster protein YjdI